MALAGSQRGWRAAIGSGTGSDGFFRSFLAGASKASGLISCRDALECQGHLPMPVLPYQLVWLCPSLWHHIMLHAGVRVRWTCQALGLYLTFLLTLAQSGDFQALALALPRQMSWGSVYPEDKEEASGEKHVGSEVRKIGGVQILLPGKGGLYSVSGSTKIGGGSPWLVLRILGQVPSLSLAQMCTSVT